MLDEPNTSSRKPPQLTRRSAHLVSAGPAGIGAYIVRQGECLSSIAFTHGHLSKTIWNHPENAALRRVRKDPHILLPGDRLYIPPIQPGSRLAVTDQKHTYVRQDVPDKLRLVLYDEEHQPRSGLAYRLVIDFAEFTGNTDINGRIEHPISPNAQSGTLFVNSGGSEERYELRLGRLDPITEISGVQGRLRNLGFLCPTDGKLGTDTIEAIRDFQDQNDLPATGELNDKTRNKLQGVHGF